MLGSIGSNLMNILKVLSPDEIESYSKESVAGQETRMAKTAFSVAAGAEGLELSGSYDPMAEHFKMKNEILKKKEKVIEEEGKAKIIPFDAKSKDLLEEKSKNEESKQKEEKVITVEEVKANPSSALESVGILSQDKMNEIETSKKKAENSKKDSATIFLLKHREKFKESKNKLIEQSGISNYKKSMVDQVISKDDDELDDDDQAQSTSTSGILLNKILD